MDPAIVYFVESQDDPTVLLAISPEYRDGYMCFMDTLRPRMIAGTLRSFAARAADFEALEGPRYRFSVLTLARYDTEVRPRVEAAPAFASEAEMHAYYLAHFG